MADYWDIVEPAFEAVSIYDGPEVFDRDVSKWPVRTQQILAVHWCNSEVCNGGFEQFFYNPTGVVAPLACEGFVAIGRPDLSSLLKAAMSIFGPSYPRDRERRMAELEAVLDVKTRLGPIDDRYYDLTDEAPGRPALYATMDAYALESPQ